MERALRQRVLFVHVSLVLMIALSATTAFVALRSTRHQAEESRALDTRLGLLHRLRADTRELAASARRFVLSGDLKEQQRVLAIVDAMKEVRAQLDARNTLLKGPVLEADLSEYIAALTNAMAFDDDDVVMRLERFEEELARIRSPLVATFDEVMTQQRKRRNAIRSTQSLARTAQWAVLIASLFGAALAIGAAVTVLRRSGNGRTEADLANARNELVAAAGELRAPLENIIGEVSQLRLRSRDSTDIRALESVARHATRLNGLLFELLDVSAMQTGTTSLRRERLDAATLVERAIKEHRESALERGVRLRYEAQLAMTVFADRERLRHVLDSLLDTAIAVARSPSELVVHIAVAEGGVRFAIIETGPGVDGTPPNELALHLCSRVVEAHGGRFGIQASSISRTYWFTLPTEPPVLR